MRQGLLLLPFETMAADTREQIHLNVAVSAALYIEKKGIAWKK
jgi:hypothetical protein